MKHDNVDCAGCGRDVDRDEAEAIGYRYYCAACMDDKIACECCGNTIPSFAIERLGDQRVCYDCAVR